MRLETRQAEIAGAGGQLLAVSKDVPAQIPALLRKLDEAGTPVSFPVLSDSSCAGIKALGVYDAEHDIGLPAVLIIDRERRLRWKYVGESVTDRPTEQALIEALRSLQSSP